MITSDQIRAARAMLRWEQTELAQKAGVSVETVRRLEKMEGAPSAQSVTIYAIMEAFERAGLEFISDEDSPPWRPGRSVGVKFALDHEAKTRQRIINCAVRSVDETISAMGKDYDLISGDPALVAEQIYKKARFLFVRLTTEVLQKAK